MDAQVKQHIADAVEAEQSGDFGKAVYQMKNALRLCPRCVPYWVSLGNLYRSMLKFQESEEAIRKAIEINPSASYAWSELGLLCRDKKLYEKAAEYLMKSVQLRPSFSTYTVLADVVLMFDADAALLHAEKALELSPGFDEAIAIRDAAKRTIGNRIKIRTRRYD